MQQSVSEADVLIRHCSDCCGAAAAYSCSSAKAPGGATRTGRFSAQCANNVYCESEIDTAAHAKKRAWGKT